MACYLEELKPLLDLGFNSGHKAKKRVAVQSTTTLFLALITCLATAIVTCLRTNQNPRIDWRRFAPPINSWVLRPMHTWLQLYNLNSSNTNLF